MESGELSKEAVLDMLKQKLGEFFSVTADCKIHKMSLLLKKFCMGKFRNIFS
jgi:hypothetical protein